MSNIVTLDFHGDRLLGFQDGSGAFIALRPVVEGMGLNWSGQLQRVRRDPILSEGVCVMHTPSDGGPQESVCLPLDLFHGFLFRIDATRVDAAVREKVITYQRECYAVLAGAFGQAPRPAEIVQAATESLPLDVARKMVAEARQSFDRQAARELWFRLGLPTVPAMRAAQAQPALFTYREG